MTTKPQQGRPQSNPGKGSKRGIMLTMYDADAKRLADIGSGNRSEGIKILLDKYNNKC